VATAGHEPPALTYAVRGISSARDGPKPRNPAVAVQAVHPAQERAAVARYQLAYTWPVIQYSGSGTTTSALVSDVRNEFYGSTI
jgi:hypothetical protein